jgi:hypothetical protein
VRDDDQQPRQALLVNKQQATAGPNASMEQKK